MLLEAEGQKAASALPLENWKGKGEDKLERERKTSLLPVETDSAVTTAAQLDYFKASLSLLKSLHKHVKVCLSFPLLSKTHSKNRVLVHLKNYVSIFRCLGISSGIYS